MSEAKPPTFDFSSVEMLAAALHAQLLARRRATLEHDIKNVVHGLLSGTELLSKSLSTSSARITPTECLTLLQQQLSRVQTTLNRILDEVAPAPQPPAEIELAELVTDCTHALRHQLQPFNVQIAVPQALRLRASRARLKDALLFAMLDCIDLSPSRARLAISAARSADGTRGTLGLEHPVDATRPSTSLLAMIAPLLTANDIDIQITTPNVDARAVELSFPLIAVTAPDTDAPDLLIVDANRDGADSLVMLVQLEGFRAEACYDAMSAMEWVRTRMPKAVLVDLDGSVDSRKLVRTIRSANGQQPRLIGLSLSPMETIAGLDASFRKPLDVQALRRSME